MTSAESESRKDELTRLLESSPTAPHCTDPTQQHNGTAAGSHPPAMIPSVFSSPISAIPSRGSVGIPHTPSTSVTNPRAYDFASQRTIHAARDATLTRSSSLRGLRAIFKRTSAGLAGSERQRAETLKERIGEPRVLSLGSVSISNLQDAGIARRTAISKSAGPVDDGVTLGNLARKTTAKW
jgi:hypothetical protein